MPVSVQQFLPTPDSAAEFEQLVLLALRARFGNPHLALFGRGGQGQHGIDGSDPLRPTGLAWQATLQRDDLVAKLVSDLAKFDAGPHARREPYLFVVGVPTDATLQLAVEGLCQGRIDAGKCPVMIVFWADLQRDLPAGARQRHYPELSWVAPPVRPICEGYVALGWDVIVEARLTSQASHSWSFELGEFFRGRAADVTGYIAGFESSNHSVRWIAFEGLGTARALAGSPTLRGATLEVSLDAQSARADVHKGGADFALGPDGDLTPDLELVSGFAASLQRSTVAMSTMLGEWFRNPLVGSRCADFYHAGTPVSTLGRLFALELARLSSIDTGDGPSLPFIERVEEVAVHPGLDANHRVQTSASLVLHGHGPWRGPLPVYVGAEPRVVRPPEPRRRRG
jgi:hypothetical protein